MNRSEEAELKSMNKQSQFSLAQAMADKYGKSHVFKVKSIKEFQSQVVEQKYPIFVMFYNKE